MGFSDTQNIANFEASCCNISLSINLLFMKSELPLTLERNDGVKLKIQTKLQVGIVVLAVVVCFYVIILTSRILQLDSVASAHSHTLWARYFQKVQPPKKTCEMNNFIEN